jgi:hypothetical protein
MGNKTNTESWAGRARMCFIETALWWEGEVNRSDLTRVFGLSEAQASADLQAYQELNPGAMAYNMRTKRYEGQEGMECVVHEPRLEEAVWRPGSGLGTEEEGGALAVGMVSLPMREPKAAVARRIVLAIRRRWRVRVRYWSVSSGTVSWRWMAPHALAHDGYRWHVRAWCENNEDYRDFVLARMERTDWPVESEEGGAFRAPVPDVEWERWMTFTLRASSGLGEVERKAIERDYGMRGGRLRYRVRAAMVRYAVDHLRLKLPGMAGLPVHLEVVDEAGG